MSENKGCSGNCSTCSSNCASKEKQSFIEPTNEYNTIKNVVAVVSGKGGVGKSMVTSLLAVKLAKKGYKVGILDADISGPSIPKSFGIKSPAMQGELGIMPAETESGIKIISVNMMLKQSDDPVIWGGPVRAGLVKQSSYVVLCGVHDYLPLDRPTRT
ncbi:MAG: Mrp/NBP35 family ATP-binding protein, partial [Clostridia bacterium]|nr:Mrp/NBP35 family ATP-binding protein [Clostridia bacterium]